MKKTNRYQRQLQLPEIGHAGQQQLAEAKVLCVGAGGLAATLTPYLAAAGVGRLGIVDDDVVDISNLHRQVFFAEKDIGSAKSMCLALRLGLLNQQISVLPYCQRVTVENVFAIIEPYSVIIDASDNFATKYLLNDAAYKMNKSLVSASVNGFQGQLCVFDFPKTPCLRCLFPEPGSALNCNQAGVIGVLPGVFGLLQALEVVKLIVGLPGLAGRLLTLDLLNYQQQVYQLRKDTQCVLCQQQQAINELHPQIVEENMAVNITVDEFKALANDQYFLLDVREDEEYITDNLGGLCIPMQQLPERLAELPKDQLIVVHCHAGVRGERAVNFLLQQGFQAKNLAGGLVAYRAKV